MSRMWHAQAASGQRPPLANRALLLRGILKPLGKAHRPAIEMMRQRLPHNPKRPDRPRKGLIGVAQREGGLAVVRLAATTSASLWVAISMAACMWQVSGWRQWTERLVFGSSSR